jgi:hypothetical protein
MVVGWSSAVYQKPKHNGRHDVPITSLKHPHWHYLNVQSIMHLLVFLKHIVESNRMPVLSMTSMKAGRYLDCWIRDVSLLKKKRF